MEEKLADDRRDTICYRPFLTHGLILGSYVDLLPNDPQSSSVIRHSEIGTQARPRGT